MSFPSNPRVLVTNDDGVHAPGLAVLEAIAASISQEVWVIAPASEQSGASRKLSLHDPLRITRLEPRRFAVSGTPTDCVLVGVQDLMDGEPDLILSGVNRGQNIAEDVTFSGTVAAAMQGVQMGVPSVAFSQAYGFHPEAKLRWETARVHGPAVLERLMQLAWSETTLMNVNFPDRDPDAVAGVEVTVQGKRDQSILHAERRTDLRGQDYYWLGFRGRLSDPAIGTDLRAVYDGRISITPIHLDMTNHEARARLADGFEGLVPASRAARG